MNYAETSPAGQVHAGANRLVDVHRPVAQQPASERFQRSTHAARAAVSERAIDMGLLSRMRKQWSTGELLYFRQVARVIDVPVGEKNGFDVGPIQVYLLEHARKLSHLTHEPGVNEHCLAA